MENVLAAHPPVASCAVVGRANDRFGERVHVVVVLAPGTQLSMEELVEHCRGKLAGYKSPRALEIRDALPLSGAEKY